MSTLLNYKISDEVRTELAKKLGAEYTVPLVIPCNFYRSSTALQLYLDLSNTPLDSDTPKSQVDFVTWYDENYPAYDYDNDGCRLATFIADLVQRDCIFYTSADESVQGDLIPVSVHATIAGIQRFSYNIDKKYDSDLKKNKYYLVDSSGNIVTDIASNSAIREGTEFISFYLDLSNWSGYNKSSESRYLLIVCK